MDTSFTSKSCLPEADSLLMDRRQKSSFLRGGRVDIVVPPIRAARCQMLRPWESSGWPSGQTPKSLGGIPIIHSTWDESMKR